MAATAALARRERARGLAMAILLTSASRRAFQFFALPRRVSEPGRCPDDEAADGVGEERTGFDEAGALQLPRIVDVGGEKQVEGGRRFGVAKKKLPLEP